MADKKKKKDVEMVHLDPDLDVEMNDVDTLDVVNVVKVTPETGKSSVEKAMHQRMAEALTTPEQTAKKLTNQIMVQSVQDNPVCALEKFMPEWKICCGIGRPPAAESLFVRRDTYTMAHHGQPARADTTFGHGTNDHMVYPSIWRPTKHPIISREANKAMLEAFFHDGLVIVDQQWRMGQLDQDPAVMNVDAPLRTPRLRDEWTVRLLPLEDDSLEEKRGKLGMPAWATGAEFPWQFQEVTNLIWNTSTQMSRLRAHDVLNCTSFSEASRADTLLRREKYAYTLVEWDRLLSLKRLFLDVRAVGRGAIIPGELVRVARKLAGSNLSVLCLAGLRSFRRWPGVRDAAVEDIERPVDPITAEPNVLRAFAGALREGGTLILLDRAEDEHTPPF